jgi:hypothetical protein
MIFHSLRTYLRILSFYCIVFSIFFIVFQLLVNKPFITEKYNPAYSQARFENSQWNSSTNLAEARILDQWALKNGFLGWGAVHFDNKFTSLNIKSLKTTLLDLNEARKISDTELYSYAGYKYIHGQDPTLLNAEAPPLGKYIIGLSIVLFNNPVVLSIFFAVLSLPFIFLITKEISGSLLAASIAVLLTSVHSLFIDQMISAPQLDIFQLFFFVVFVYMFLLTEKKKNNVLFIFAGAILGLFFSIKLSIVSFFLMNTSLLLYFILKKENIKTTLQKLLLLNSMGGIVFLLTYSEYFLQHGTLKGFLSVQKWIFYYYSNSSIDLLKLLGSYIPLILANKWKFWSNGYSIISYDHWSVVWPIIYVLGIASVIQILKSLKKYDYRVKFPLSFFIVYSSVLCVITIFPRYLLLLFVPLHILIAVCFAKILKDERTRSNNKI